MTKTQNQWQTNFDEWNEIKKEIDKNHNNTPFIKEWFIYYTKLWKNIWFEEDWKKDYERPVLVVSKIWNLFFCISMTTKGKDNKYYYRLKNTNFTKIHIYYCLNEGYW